ncbi:hypothetical protein, partial [Vibrio parahaemolyticus]|uniref:hypothetical protein n=1 Tax=Vibrio parahaemolyticus TaxID=670 RepID=UPI001BAF7833
MINTELYCKGDHQVLANKADAAEFFFAAFYIATNFQQNRVIRLLWVGSNQILNLFEYLAFD